MLIIDDVTPVNYDLIDPRRGRSSIKHYTIDYGVYDFPAAVNFVCARVPLINLILSRDARKWPSVLYENPRKQNEKRL